MDQIRLETEGIWYFEDVRTCVSHSDSEFQLEKQTGGKGGGGGGGSEMIIGLPGAVGGLHNYFVRTGLSRVI